MFDIITVSREIEEVDMVEYLRPVDYGADVAQEVLKSFPAISQMKNEDIFKTIFNVELLYYRNLQKTRSQIVALFHIACCLKRTRKCYKIFGSNL